MKNRPRSKARMETSKKLLLCTGAIFGLSVVVGVAAAFRGVDATFLAAVIAVTGGVFGSAIVAYENKAKMENIVKIKMAIIKFRLAAGKYLTPEQMAQVEGDIASIETAIDSKIDDTVTETVSADAEIKTF
jgi:hypothetical protein